MTAWMIVIGILLLINLIRIGVWCEYSDDGFALALKLACFKIRILPAKPKTPEQIEADRIKKAEKKEKSRLKKEQKKAEKEQHDSEKDSTEAEAEKKRKKGALLDIVLSAIHPAFDAVGTFFRHLKISTLRAYYTVAGDDPFDTVMTYGAASAGVSVLNAYLFRLNVKKRDFRTFIDLNADKPRVYLEAELGMHVWEYFYLLFRLAGKFIVRYIKRIIRSRRKAAERM